MDPEPAPAPAFNNKTQEYGFVFPNHKMVYMQLLSKGSYVTKTYNDGGRVQLNITPIYQLSL
jgi:hypothetical protein